MPTRKPYSGVFTLAIAALGVLLSSSTLWSQSVINVPADQPTIQAAIQAASNGDTVLVAPGTYPENIDFLGKLITVTSSGGAAMTIVDGGAAGPVVIFDSNEGASSVLNGFTLQNGMASFSFPGWGSGGGILIYYASPTITNNVIADNHAVCGIGVEIQGGSAVIRGNTITGNTQAGGDGGCGGGGIEVTGDSSHPAATPQIIGNTITNNSLAGGGFGGGIGVSYFSSPIIQNNYIAGNSVYNSGGGINLQSYDAAVVVQNIIVNNSAGGGGSGGGMNVEGPSSSADVVTSNTIVGNTAFDGSSGIFADVLSPVAISNNIVVAAPGQNAIVCSPFSSTFPTFSHNDVTSPGGGQAWSSNCASAAQSNGNISADPQFLNVSTGDFHLQPNSPAIDAGTNAVASLPQTDYAGNPRILDGNNDCVSTVDIGAYELVRSASAAFSVNSLVFPGQLIGTSSAPQQVTLSNTGTTCFQFSATQITGDFSETNSCAAAGLPGGSSCSYSVTFTPITGGTRAGALTVTGSDGVTTSSPSVALSGTGLASPNVSLSTASLTFGPQAVGTSSAAQGVMLSNTGGAPLNITAITTGTPFSQTNNCPASLAAGAACSISVTYAAVAAGTQTGSLSISDNAGGSPQTVALSGTAVDFFLFANPSSESVRRGQSPLFTVPVNPLGGPFNSSVALSCSGLPSFASCSFSPTSVVPGASGAQSTLTISTTGKTPRGTFTINVIGQSGSLQHTATITLTVR
jgi:Right handed beta helix region